MASARHERKDGSIHLRHAALLSLLAVIVLAAVDVRVAWEVRAPVAIVLLVVALGFALRDPIRSVWVTHHTRAHAHVAARPRSRLRPRVDRTRGSRPGWL